MGLKISKIHTHTLTHTHTYTHTHTHTHTKVRACILLKKSATIAVVKARCSSPPPALRLVLSELEVGGQRRGD
jgi:hypothetical protein